MTQMPAGWRSYPEKNLRDLLEWYRMTDEPGFADKIEEELSRRKFEERVERLLKAATKMLPELVGMRDAAKLLRIDRSTTLTALVRRGLVKTVQKGSREAIPRSEIERLVHEGIPDVSGKTTKRRVRKKKGSGTNPDKIRNLDLDKLR